MGALRAAELAPFGMLGVGAIYADYVSGVIQDDDDVVVAHAGREHDYRCLSTALVNLRWTFRAAEAAGVISDEVRRELDEIARALPYAERTLDAVLRIATDYRGINGSALRLHLETHRVDRKREDALQMLHAMSEEQRSGFRRPAVTFDFAHTDAWDALERQVRARQDDSDREKPQTALVHELLVAGQYAVAHYAMLARASAEERAPSGTGKADGRATQAIADEFRRERGLESSEAFERWCTEQVDGDEELTAFFEREGRFRRVAATATRQDCLIDHLRSTGQYARLMERARSKHEVLLERGLASAGLEATGLDPAQLWRWWNERSGEVRTHRTLRAQAQNECVAEDELRDAIVREYLYARVVLK